MTTYKIALATHIVGITLMAGTTFFDYIVFRQFQKLFSIDRSKSIFAEEMLNKLQKFIGTGMIVIILSGVLMMVYMHQVWGQQIWFRIKMGILVLIIINGFVIRKRLGLKLKKLLAGGTPGSRFMQQFSGVQVLQMLLFIIIFVLSVFKFN